MNANWLRVVPWLAFCCACVSPTTSIDTYHADRRAEVADAIDAPRSADQQESMPQSGSTAPITSTAATHSSIRVLSDSSIHVYKTWYDDEYQHADVDGVDCTVLCSDDTRTMTLSIASIEGQKTAGIRLDIQLSTSDRGEPVAHVVGHWKTDVFRSNIPSHGQLDDFNGEIYLSSSYFVRSRPLSIKFHLTTKVQDHLRVLMGGIRVKD